MSTCRVCLAESLCLGAKRSSHLCELTGAILFDRRFTSVSIAPSSTCQKHRTLGQRVHLSSESVVSKSALVPLMKPKPQLMILCCHVLDIPWRLETPAAHSHRKDTTSKRDMFTNLSEIGRCGRPFVTGGSCCSKPGPTHPSLARHSMAMVHEEFVAQCHQPRLDHLIDNRRFVVSNHQSRIIR